MGKIILDYLLFFIIAGCCLVSSYLIGYSIFHKGYEDIDLQSTQIVEYKILKYPDISKKEQGKILVILDFVHNGKEYSNYTTSCFFNEVMETDENGKPTIAKHLSICYNEKIDNIKSISSVENAAFNVAGCFILLCACIFLVSLAFII